MFNTHLQNAWIRQLRDDWRAVNYCNFNSVMIPPEIELIDSEKKLGQWSGGKSRKIAISAPLIKNYPWQYVQEVLFHEVSHQYVDEILGIRDEGHHGMVFKKICKKNGFDHRATGDIKQWVDSKRSGERIDGNHKILDKIQKLLSLAQSMNQHEAELAMTRAQELLLKHNLSLMELDRDPNYINKQIGEVGKKNPIKSQIGILIRDFFFVETLWIFGYNPLIDKKGRMLEIYGTPENVELAEYVHDYLHNVSEKFWIEYKEQKMISGNRHRRTYIYGLLNGFYEKLDVKVAENRTKNLVWAGDPLLKEYYRKRNPKISKSTSSHSRTCKDAYESGVTRGKRLVIHKGIKNSAGSGKVFLLK